MLPAVRLVVLVAVTTMLPSAARGTPMWVSSDSTQGPAAPTVVVVVGDASHVVYDIQIHGMSVSDTIVEGQMYRQLSFPGETFSASMGSWSRRMSLGTAPASAVPAIPLRFSPPSPRARPAPASHPARRVAPRPSLPNHSRIRCVVSNPPSHRTLRKPMRRPRTLRHSWQVASVCLRRSTNG